MFQLPRGRPPAPVIYQDLLPGETGKERSRKSKAGKPRSPGQGSFQEECPRGWLLPHSVEESWKVSYASELSQCLSFTGQGCPGGRIPRPCCSLPFG